MAFKTNKLSLNRYIVLVVLAASLLSIALLCAVIGIQSPLLDRAMYSDRFRELPSRAARVLQKLTVEQRIACNFLVSNFPGDTDTERQAPLVAAQTDTIMEVQNLFAYYTPIVSAADDSTDPSLLFPFAAILEVQAATLKRTQTPGQISIVYQLAKQRMIQVLMGAVLRTSALRHSSSFTDFAMSNVLFSDALERAALNANLRNNVLREDGLTLLINIETNFQTQCSIFLGVTSDEDSYALLSAMQSASRRTVDTLKTLISFPPTWSSQLEPADVTSDELTQALSEVLLKFIVRQDEILQHTYRPTLLYGVIIACCIAGVVFVLVPLALALRKLTWSSLTKEIDLERDHYIDTLGRSYDRTIRFLNSLVRLDIANMKGAEGKSVQPVEREVYALEQHVKTLLRLLNPVVPRWRSLQPTPPMGAPPVPRKLVAVPSSILVIDMRSYHIRPTGETIKTYPTTMSNLLHGISSIVESVDGVVQEVSATRIVVAWNLIATNADHEMSACRAAIAVSKAYSTETAPLRSAIVTGQIMAGVVGSDTFRPFVVLGKPLMLAGHLIKVAHAHHVTACVDTATFSTLDSQQFLTRPLEVLAVPGEGRDVEYVTVHELVCQSSRSYSDGRRISWNQAFDAFVGGDFTKAIPLLKEYQKTYGNNRSIQRLMALMMVGESSTAVADLQDFYL